MGDLYEPRPPEEFHYRRVLAVAPAVAVTQVAAALTTPWEALVSVTRTHATPWEALVEGPVPVAAALTSPWEALQGVTQTRVLPWEAGGGTVWTGHRVMVLGR